MAADKALFSRQITKWLNSEDILYNRYATLESRYALSNIQLPDDFHEFRQTTTTEFSNNCKEKDFSFIKQGMWTIGLIASRHYRTYIFPYYWRQFLKDDEAVAL